MGVLLRRGNRTHLTNNTIEYQPRNTYCLFDDCLVFQGSQGQSDVHAHHYLQYGFSDSASIELYAPGRIDTQRVRSFFIPSDVSHQVCLKGNDRVLMVWLDPEYHFNRLLSHTKEIKVTVQDLEDGLAPLSNQDLNCEIARQIRSVIAGRSPVDKSRVLDDRVSDAINWIEMNLPNQTITVEKLAEAVFLSPSRFMHLFSGQIGIPVRKYILWQRLRHALLLMADGISITKAAHAAGFTDSPHMNRTFNAMFGITPSKIFKNSRFIQVIAC